MDETTPENAAPERRRLTQLAYRMLGSYAEAEDVVQDAYLRFQAVDQEGVRNAQGYLTTTVARLCLDRMKSARARRETYFGTWLPEPILSEEPAGPDVPLQLADDLSYALLLTLERLSPPERSAFLLHDVFGMEFGEISALLERTSASCRKLAERAREQVQAGRARFRPEPQEESRLLHAFLEASASGDLAGLTQLLAADAVMYSDGGGKRQATPNPIYGRERIVRFFTRVPNKASYQRPRAVIPCRINQAQGCLMEYDDGSITAFAIDVRDGVIARLYIVANPDKLTHLRPVH